MRATAFSAQFKQGWGESALLSKACSGKFAPDNRGVTMNKFLKAASMAALSLGMAHSALAQTNGLDPANLPPAGFEGREFTDSAGCEFLRSTFGGEVTWVPRYGPDRNPICDQTPTDFAAAAASQPAQDPDTGMAEQADASGVGDDMGAMSPEADMAEAGTPEPVADAEPARGRIEVVGAVDDPVRRPAPSYLGKERTVASVAPRQQVRRAAPKPRLQQADASGRHPSCPGSAPYGQLVDTELGRKMVRCVTSPSLFLDEYVNTPPRQVAHTPRVAAGHGNRIQVGSFAVPGNAQRLVARLNARGLPAGTYRARGLNVVTVGPFASGAAAHGALATVRAMGFGDAFLRR